VTSRTLFVVHPGGLGDVLLSRLTLCALRRLYPRRRLGLLAGSEVGGILKACGEIDTLFPLESSILAELLTGPDDLGPTTREWLANCDVAIAWTGDPVGVLRSTFAAFDIEQVVMQSTSILDDPATAEMHQSERLLRTLPSTGNVIQRAASLSLPETAIAEGAALLKQLGLQGRDVVAVHPGSGSPHKCILPDVLAGAVRGLEGEGIVPVLIEGPADGPLVDALLHSCAHQLPVLRGMRLMAVAGVVAHVKLFVGHDSGLSHLAAALDRPTVALFGPTEPRRWGPQGRTKVLRGAPCRCGTWQDVQTCREKVCLRISADDILTAARQINLESLASSSPQLVLPERMC